MFWDVDRLLYKARCNQQTKRFEIWVDGHNFDAVRTNLPSVTFC